MHKNRIDWLLKIQIKNSLILNVVSVKLFFYLIYYAFFCIECN